MEKSNKVEAYNEPKAYSQAAYKRAEERLKKVKGFYWHFSWYVAVNIFITVSKVSSDMSEGLSLVDALFQFDSIAVWVFWGIGVVAHWFGVFGKNIFFNKEWEARKIKEYMDKDHDVTNTYE